MKYLAISITWIVPLQLLAQNIRLTETERSVVQIAVEKPDSTIVPYGTGFFVRSDGVIVTALHVYTKALLATAENRGGRVLVRRATRQSGMVSWAQVDVLEADVAHDLALLKLVRTDPSVWDAVGGIKALAPTKVTEVDPGLSVRVVGYFGTDLHPITLSAHLVGATVFTISPGNDVQEFLVSAFAVPGHSGSPVLLDDGSVLGVIGAMVPVTVPFNSQPLHSGLNRVTKAEHLQRLLSSLSPATAVPPAATAPR